ncbi:indolethylamine N-methyltransferase-like [Lissotriton helveticus]
MIASCEDGTQESRAEERMAATSSIRDLYDQFFDARKMTDLAFASDSEFYQDSINEMFSGYNKLLSSGDVKGDTLIAMCFGPFIYYALPASEHFSEIIFSCPNDKSIQELEKWLKNEPDALDWSHVAKFICELEGKSENWMEKLSMLRRKIKKCLKCDVSSGNPLCPIIQPQADCLLLAHCLELFVTDKKSFCDALKNVSSLLKTGGHLIMNVNLNETFFLLGDVKFPHLCIDEGYLKKTLVDAGYVIVEHHVYHRQTNALYDVTDYEGVIILKALKQREI